MRVDSYNNPGGECAHFDGNCCDVLTLMAVCSPSKRPDPFFIFCLRSADKTYSNSSVHKFGREMSTNEQDTVSLTFNEGTDALLGLSNPLAFDVSRRWPVRQ